MSFSCTFLRLNYSTFSEVSIDGTVQRFASKRTEKWYKKLCEAACCQSVNQETSTIEYEVVQ